jgi:ATP-dependent Clp protease adaptor protein ClpS
MTQTPVVTPNISPGENLAEQVRPALERPPMFKVLLLNDDYTPMDFVVQVLEKFFQKDTDEAVRIMIAVHQNGVGLCGVYPFEVAETKALQVVEFARSNDHPLQTAIEKE